MIIRKLELENFRCFEEQVFKFPEGVIGILGPNGSGKSTILEGLSWALYGSSALRTNRDNLRLDSAPDSSTCRVKMKFRLDGDNYELERSMTGTSLSPKAYIRNSNETLAESFQGVTRYVEQELLRMKESSFFRSVFSKQNEVRDLSSGGPEERRQLFAKLLDIDRIKAARREIDADARQKRQRAEALEGQLDDLAEMQDRLKNKKNLRAEAINRVSSLEDKLNELNEKIDRREADFQELEDKKDKLSELEKIEENLRTRLSNYRENIEERKEELKELNLKKEKAEELEGVAETYKELERRKNSLEQKKDRYRDKKELESSLESKEETLNRERSKLNEVKEELQEYEDVPGELDKKKAKRKNEDEAITELKTRRAELESSLEKRQEELEELKEKEKHVEDLGEKGDCPVCKRPLDDDYETVINHYREDIKDIKKEIKEIKEEKKKILNRLESTEERKEKLDKSIEELEEKNRTRVSLTDRAEDLRKRIKNLEEERKELKVELEDLGKVDYDEKEYEDVKKDLDKLEEDYQTYRNLLAETKRISKVEAKVGSLKDKLEETGAELRDVKRRLNDVEFDREEFSELKEDLKELREEKDSLKDKYAEETENLAGLKSEINHLKEDIENEENKRDRLNQLREDKLLLERVSNYFDQFRLDLLNRIRPVLSRRASSLLERTTDGRYRKLTIDDNYLVSVYEDGNPYPLDRFSGGETDLANLCLRVAISELVARRSGRPVNFIVLDEIFGSQDQQRRQNILQALRNLDDLFGQIFLITHSEEVKERLENVVLLSRENREPTTVKVLF